MVETVLRSRRRRAAGQRLVSAAARYAALGWPVCAGAHPPGRADGGDPRRACSCDRIGCPAPAAHPVSPAWQLQASTDPGLVASWWSARPLANVILVTGRIFDVLDVPAPAGMAALARLDKAGMVPGPVAISAGDRALFFVATRGAPDAPDEWWSCHLDCEPEMVGEVTGLRWHCRGSFVLAPPSPLADGQRARWIHRPASQRAAGGRPPPPGGPQLPDGLRLLEYLADACEETGQ